MKIISTFFLIYGESSTFICVRTTVSISKNINMYLFFHFFTNSSQDEICTNEIFLIVYVYKTLEFLLAVIANTTIAKVTTVSELRNIIKEFQLTFN